MNCEIHFEDSAFEHQKVPKGENLSEHLHACNSPLLFGCRSGLCGVCLVEVLEGECSPIGADEKDALAVYAPDNPRARLACQIEPLGNLKVKSIKD